MHHTPTPDSTPARRITCVLIGAGIAVFMLSPIVPTGRALFQLAAVLLFTVGIYVTVRYLMTSFSYAVEPRNAPTDDGTVSASPGAFHLRHLPPSALDFVVRKSQGQRVGMVEARLSMEELLYFSPLPPKGGRKREAYRLYPTMRSFRYTVSLRPTAQYIAVFEDAAGNQIGVIFEPCETMAEYFAHTAEKNRMK